MGKATTRLAAIIILLILAIWVGPANAATISLVPSASSVMPGGDLSVDVVVNGIPQDGLDSVQFRLNVQAGSVAAVSDLSQASANNISIALPLQMSPADLTHSGLGDFFLGGAGPNGVLALDNETLSNGSALFTYAHTYGATPPAGGGTIARFMVHVGESVPVQSFQLNLTDVMLLNNGNEYALTDIKGAMIQVGCFATIPDLTGMTLENAQSALTSANLALGRVYEVMNDGTKPLGRVLEQSAKAGDKVSCNTVVDIAIDTAPTSAINPVANSSALSGSSLTFTGSASDGTGSGVSKVEVSIGGSPWVLATDASGNGSWSNWSYAWTLPVNGTYAVQARATDNVGNVQTALASTAVTVANPLPVAVLSGVPAGPTRDTAATLTVGGANMVAYRYNLDGGVELSEAALGTPITLSGLGDGTHTVYVVGRDAIGNWQASPIAASWLVDTTGPDVKLSMLPDGAVTANPVLNISGSVSDAGSGLKVLTVNGVDATSAAAGFSRAFKLAEGINTITVTANDNLDNHTTQTRVITYDPTAPTLSVTAPADNSKTNLSSVDVAGTADASATVGVKVNGTDDQLAARDGANFTATVLLSSGINTIEVTVTDQSGKTAVEKRTVTMVDAAKPSLAITDPIRDIVSYQNVVVIKGSVTSAAGNTTITINNGTEKFQPSAVKGLFEQQVDFTDSGTYPINVAATDINGNETVVQRNVIFIKTDTALSSDKPSPQTQGYPVTFTATASGGSGSYEYQFMLFDGQTWKEVQAYSSASTWTWDTTTVTPATYSLKVNVRNVGDGDAYDVFSTMDYVIQKNTIPPTLTVPPDIIKEATGPLTSVDLGAATADGICKPITVTNNAPVAGYPLGTKQVTWTAMDANGLITTAFQNVTVVDTTPPVSLIYPSASAISGLTYTVTGASMDIASGVSRVEVSIGGSPWAQAVETSGNGSWSTWGYVWTLPVNGTYIIQARATDNAGNVQTALASTALTVANPLPVAVLSGAPSGPTRYTDATLTVSGTNMVAYKYGLDGGVESAETALGTPISLSGLNDGTHTVYVIGRDAIGNWQTSPTTASWLVDTTGPDVKLSMLPDGAVTANLVLNVSGSATDVGSGLKTLTVNGVDAASDAAGFSRAFKLAVGVNAITVTSSDNLDNQMTQTRTVTYDPTAPALVVAAPADNSKTSLSSVDVTGTADAGSRVEVKVNGADDQLAARNGANFTATVLLSSSINTIEVTVTDQAGRTAVEKRSVTMVDAAKPSLAIIDPVRDVVSYLNSLVIKGSVTNAMGDVAVTVTSGANTFNPSVSNGSFEQNVTFTDEGTYQINIGAADIYGNETVIQRNIIYQKIGLAVSSDKPSPQTQGYPVTFTATASGGSGSYEYQFLLYDGQAWKEVQAYSSANTWTWDTTTVTPGVYTLEVNVRNAGENVALDTSVSLDFTIEQNTIPPTLAVPPDIIKEATGPLTPVDLGTASADGICKPVTVSNNALASGFPVDANSVTWTAKDVNGLTTTAVQKVTVEDTTPPVVVAPANITVEATGPVTPISIGVGTAHDLVDGDIRPTNNAPTAFPVGETTVIWIAMDSHGNTGAATQIITVQDTTPPALTVPGSIHILLNTPPTDPSITSFFASASANDLADGTVAVTYNQPSSYSVIGPMQITFTSIDGHGNQAAQSSWIYVEYAFDGFLPPVSLNKPFKLGSTIPVKFQLKDYAGNFISNATATLMVQPYANGVPDGDPITVTSNADNGNMFRYDQTGQQYIYNLSTKGLTIGSWMLIVYPGDGTVRTNIICLK